MVGGRGVVRVGGGLEGVLREEKMTAVKEAPAHADAAAMMASVVLDILCEVCEVSCYKKSIVNLELCLDGEDRRAGRRACYSSSMKSVVKRLPMKSSSL